MALMHIPLEQIRKADLARLIQLQATETLYIDYKRETYGSGESDHAEYLADVSSFANSADGDLVIGVSEKNGVPVSLVPFTGDIDTEIRRLEEMARGGIEPRITNLRIQAIPLGNGGVVIVIRVPRSFNPPHRVTYRGRDKFWVRSSLSKFRPNVEELRGMFLRAPQLTDQIRQFRSSRISEISQGASPVAMATGSKIVLHLVPLSAFDIGQSLSIRQVVQNSHLFPPLERMHAADCRVNVDGLLTYSNATPGVTEQPAYCQVFRSGIVEAVEHWGASDRPIATALIGNILVKYALCYSSALSQCGVEPPFSVLLT